jgi:inhibitor of cysteine peptidase
MYKQIYFISLAGFMALQSCTARNPIQLRNPQLQTYANCAELKKDYQKISSQYAAWANERGWPIYAEGDPVSATSGATKTIIDNRQTAGVEEPDVVKISPGQIFYATQNSIVVLDRTSHKQIGNIDTSHLTDVKLHSSLTRLWLTGTFRSSNTTAVESYLLGSGVPVYENRKVFEGSLLNSRVKDGKLLLILNSYLFSEKIESIASNVDGVPCTQVTHPIINDNDWSATSLTSISIDAAPTVIDSLTIVGSSDTLYMSENSLYLVKRGSNLCGWSTECAEFAGARDPESIFRTLQNSSIVSEISFDTASGKFSLEGLGVVKGSIKDSWALQEYQKKGQTYLAVATTENARSISNHLFVLKKSGTELTEVGGVHHFAANEDTRAVRFSGNMAYVVTFEKTDPLWAISLEDLENPQITSELKVPGFSTYLHPVSDRVLLGVGLDAVDQGDFSLLQGIQFSLFDVSDAFGITRKDNHIFGGRGSFSDASSDRHAFYFDGDANIVAIPTFEFNQVPESSWDMGQTRLFSGARFFKIDEELGHIGQLDAVTHFDLVPRACDWKVFPRWGWYQDEASVDIQRIIQVDGQLITLSPFGEKLWSLSEEGRMTLTQVEEFGDLGDVCSQRFYY